MSSRAKETEHDAAGAHERFVVHLSLKIAETLATFETHHVESVCLYDLFFSFAAFVSPYGFDHS